MILASSRLVMFAVGRSWGRLVMMVVMSCWYISGEDTILARL